MKRRYPILGIIAVIYQILGVIVVISAVIVAIILMIQGVNQTPSPPTTAAREAEAIASVVTVNFEGSPLALGVSLLISGLVGGFALFAIGELINLLRDLELNGRIAAEHNRQAAHYTRIAAEYAAGRRRAS
jgi:hypothetical protein